MRNLTDDDKEFLKLILQTVKKYVQDPEPEPLPVPKYQYQVTYETSRKPDVFRLK